MKYKKAKIIVINWLADTVIVDFGWKFRVYPKLRKQMKQWAREVLEE